MQDAGAAAIELNIYYIPGDPHITGREVEQRHIDILCRVKDAVTVPVAVKLSPYFSSAGEMALRLDEAGADGLVLFNRFLQPDIDPETLAVVPAVDLSSPAEARLPRTWISILRQRVRASLAATTGVEGPADVVKYLLAGADVVMTASALIRHGPGHAAVLLDGLSEWMARKGYPSVAEVRGMLAVPAGTDQAAYERAGYVRAMQSRQQLPRPVVTTKEGPRGWCLSGRSSLVRAGELVIRAATSWPRARISASACRECAAKHSSPIGERMVRAQYRTATALSSGLCSTARLRGSPAVPSVRRAANAPVMARHMSVRVARSAARRTGSVPHR